VHDRLLAELLGPRPALGALPRRLRELAERIGAAFGGRQVSPDSSAQLVRAFAAAGVTSPRPARTCCAGVDHPAVPLLLEYKELSRLHAAHGWSWLDSWVWAGRFRPEYVPGGVVSGRWATRGGGALQIPRAVRRAAVADPGWTFVVADAGQLEPRVLAAMYGQAGGEAGQLRGVRRSRFPEAVGHVEAAARAGRRAGWYGRGWAGPARRRRRAGWS